MMADGFLKPFRHRRIREGNLGVDRGRETVLSTVRNVPMTVPACLPLAVLRHFEVHLAQLYHFSGEFRMTSDAIGTTYKKLTNPDCGNIWGKWDPKKHTVEDAAKPSLILCILGIIWPQRYEKTNEMQKKYL